MLHVPRGFATASRTDGAGNSSVVWDFESSPSALLQLEACASNFGSSRCDTYEAVLTIQT
jgi:hypothetical protein